MGDGASLEQRVVIGPRELGRSGLRLSPIGFGAFKIGRNEAIKYAQGYDLPDDNTVRALLAALLDMGVTYIDTAPAYGTSEQRIGRLLPRKADVVISTKVGERFEDGRSSFDFSPAAVAASLEQSAARLGRTPLDLVFIHSNGRDMEIIRESGAVEALQDAKRRGLVRAIGFSGKTVGGAEEAMSWADALMVTFNLDDRSHEGVIAAAAQRGIGVVVKKGLAAGQLDAAESVRFVLGNRGVTSLVIGTLNAEHMKANVAASDDTNGCEAI